MNDRGSDRFGSWPWNPGGDAWEEGDARFDDEDCVLDMYLPIGAFYGTERGRNGEDRKIFVVEGSDREIGPTYGWGCALLVVPAHFALKVDLNGVPAYQISFKSIDADKIPLWPLSTGENPERDMTFKPSKTKTFSEIDDLCRKTHTHPFINGEYWNMGPTAKYDVQAEERRQKKVSVPIECVEERDDVYIVDFEGYGKVKFPKETIVEHPIKKTIDIKGTFKRDAFLKTDTGKTLKWADVPRVAKEMTERHRGKGE